MSKKPTNLKSNNKTNYVWAIYVNKVIKRIKKPNFDDNYTDVMANNNYILKYNSLGEFSDCRKNNFFNTFNVYGTAYILHKDGDVENIKTPKSFITELISNIDNLPKSNKKFSSSWF